MSTLFLDGVSIEPPRAARGNLRTHAARLIHRLVGGIPDFRAWWRRLRVIVPEPLDPTALAWSFIPGLGHLKTGRLRLGRVLLPAWVLLFLCTLLYIGTTTCWWFLTGMIAVHALAIASLFASNLAYERTPMRAAFGLVVFLALQFFIYQPSVWFCSRFAVAVPIDDVRAGHVIASGDGLICEGAWLRPATFSRGDIVLYEIGELYTAGFVIRGGWSVDRVIGIPGDHVQRVKGLLTVNGETVPPHLLPLSSVPHLDNVDINLSASQYAIFTVVGRGFNLVRGQQLTPPVIQHLTVVDGEQIVGRVVFRLRPWSRFGRVG
jgi:hypothetical protein